MLTHLYHFGTFCQSLFLPLRVELRRVIKSFNKVSSPEKAIILASNSLINRLTFTNKSSTNQIKQISLKQKLGMLAHLCRFGTFCQSLFYR